jgi:hypothetical protein
VTLRVDLETQVAVEMRSTEKYSSDDPTVERVYAIDYPEAGPADVYALGVPRDANVVDRRHARTNDSKEIRDFLEAYVQARGKPLEPFKATVLIWAPSSNWRGFGIGLIERCRLLRCVGPTQDLAGLALVPRH